jgi:pimeloyl-ACP methyl ester carboxylesterase
MMKKKTLKIIKIILIITLLFIVFQLFHPTWTPSIKGENSISELTKVTINGVGLEVMVRGNDRNNPVLIFVHGGPCCSEIPYVRKYQENLEKDFTIVHYDQRGSGKSYEFGKDYSMVTAATHTNDLIALTEYMKEYLGKEQVILIGHSYGTYIATMAASQRPDLYQAYIGIGQMSNTIESELSSLAKCLTAAENAGNETDVKYLKSLETAISNGESITPRNYVRKYGFAARKIDDNGDYLKGFLFGTEYNLLDAIRFYTASIKYQDALIMEALDNPITGIVTEINITVYFVMGKYDGMTSPETAENYLNSITGEGTKELTLFDESAHYPQFEEEEKFYQWMKDIFRN